MSQTLILVLKENNMSFVKLLLSVPDSAVTMKDNLQLNVAGNHFDVQGLDKMIGDMIDGALAAYTKLSTGVIQSTATITFTGAPVDGEALVLANLTFTAKTSASGEFQFEIGANVTETAANLVTILNASASLAGIVTTTSAAGVVTLTAVQPGKTGNGLVFTEALANTTLVAFANGSDGDEVAINFGRSS